MSVFSQTQEVLILQKQLIGRLLVMFDHSDVMKVKVRKRMSSDEPTRFTQSLYTDGQTVAPRTDRGRGYRRGGGAELLPLSLMHRTDGWKMF